MHTFFSLSLGCGTRRVTSLSALSTAGWAAGGAVAASARLCCFGLTAAFAAGRAFSAALNN